MSIDVSGETHALVIARALAVGPVLHPCASAGAEVSLVRAGSPSRMCVGADVSRLSEPLARLET